MHRALAFLVLSTLATAVEARPVTYPGGSMSMTEVDGSNVTTQIDHTLNRSLAVGVYALTESDGNRRSMGVLGNLLLVRSNEEDSQANIYLMAGAGPSWVRDADGDGRSSVGSGYVGAEADWETRRLLVGASAKLSIVGNDTEVGWRTRVGVAPYVANAGAVHTWLMLQVGKSATSDARTQITPLVRLFRGSILAEAGISHRGRAFGTLWFYF